MHDSSIWALVLDPLMSTRAVSVPFAASSGAAPVAAGSRYSAGSVLRWEGPQVEGARAQGLQVWWFQAGPGVGVLLGE